MSIRGRGCDGSLLEERDGQFLVGKLLQLAWGVTATVNLINNNNRRVNAKLLNETINSKVKEMR